VPAQISPPPQPKDQSCLKSPARSFGPGSIRGPSPGPNSAARRDLPREIGLIILPRNYRRRGPKQYLRADVQTCDHSAKKQGSVQVRPVSRDAQGDGCIGLTASRPQNAFASTTAEPPRRPIKRIRRDVAIFVAPRHRPPIMKFTTGTCCGLGWPPKPLSTAARRTPQ